jgi:hypothetical protein
VEWIVQDGFLPNAGEEWYSYQSIKLLQKFIAAQGS